MDTTINVGDWLPWESPEYIPGNPHNLPTRPDALVRLTPQEAPSGGFLPSGTAIISEPYRYASITSLTLSGVGTTSIKFLDAPIGKRNFLGFRNASTGTQNLYIDFNSAASSNSWLVITPGTIVLFDTVVPQDDLYVVADAASGILSYAYSTFGG